MFSSGFILAAAAPREGQIIFPYDVFIARRDAGVRVW